MANEPTPEHPTVRIPLNAAVLVRYKRDISISYYCTCIGHTDTGFALCETFSGQVFVQDDSTYIFNVIGRWKKQTFWQELFSWTKTLEPLNTGSTNENP
jgi:hypothetical protein